MEDTEHAFATSVFIFDHTVQKVSADDASHQFSHVTQENFWRMWPQIKGWADHLYDLIEEDRRAHSQAPDDDDDHAELGGGG